MVPSHVRQHVYDCVDCEKSDPIKWIQKGAVGPPLDRAKITHSAAQQGLGLKLTRSYLLFDQNLYLLLIQTETNFAWLLDL